MSRRRARGRVLLALGVVLAGLALLLAGLWQARLGMAEAWLRGQVRDLGVADVTLRVDALGVSGIAVRDVALGPASEATVAEIDVAWSIDGLLAGRFDRVEVRGARARAALGESGLDLGALAPLLEPDPEASDAPPALPAPAIRIEDAGAMLDTPEGPAQLRLEAAVDEEASGRLRADLRLGLVHERAEAQAALSLAGSLEAMEGTLDASGSASIAPLQLDGPLRVSGPLSFDETGLRASLHVEPLGFALADPDPTRALRGRSPALDVGLEARTGEPPQVRLRGAGGRVEAAGATASGLALNLLLRGGIVDGDLRAARVELPDAALPPLEVDLNLRGRPDSLVFRSRVTTAKGRVVVRANGVANAETASADAAFELEPLTLGEAGTRIAELLPAARGLGVDVRGQVEARGRASLAGENAHVRLEAALRDVRVASQGAVAEGVNGTLVVTGPTPLVTEGEQLISIGLVDVGVPLQDGLLRFELLPSGQLRVPSARFRMLGGEVRAGVQLSSGAEEVDVVLVAFSLDLAEILDRVALDGLSGSGRVSGTIPVEIRGKEIRVVDAALRGNPEGGRIRYRPSAQAGAVAAQQASTLGLAVDALRDLAWESLELRMYGDARGDMTTKISLRGSNPEFQGGRPVELNLSLEARLSDLVEAGAASYRVPEVIEERLRSYGDRSPREGR